MRRLSQEVGQCVVAVLPDNAVVHYHVWEGVGVGVRMPQRKLLGLGGGTRRGVVGAKFSGREDG